ncbi:hypothetical protein DSECCO2_504730 [anaerobic digester metagenome]
MFTSLPARLSTMQLVTLGQPFRASSTLPFKGIFLPARSTASAVTRTLASQSWMRFMRLEAEKPAKTMEWVAPMRVQASMATASSGTMGMYRATRSPRETPSFFRMLAKRTTSARSSRKVMWRTSSSGSPCQMIAVLSPRPFSTCRSRQL